MVHLVLKVMFIAVWPLSPLWDFKNILRVSNEIYLTETKWSGPKNGDTPGIFIHLYVCFALNIHFF